VFEELRSGNDHKRVEMCRGSTLVAVCG
jgi:hypothetical protein